MSTTDPEHINAAALPQNGGSEANITEKPASEPVNVPADPVKPVHAEPAENPKNKLEQDDKLDELSCLELELAELNKTDSKIKSQIEFSTQNEKNEKSGKTEKSELAQKKDHVSSEKADEHGDDDGNQNGCSNVELSKSHCSSLSVNESEMLNHDDLIAVLKGETTDYKKSDSEECKAKNVFPSKTDAVASTRDDLIEVEGVTIEGEGEYQIMEVIDDFDDEIEGTMVATSHAITGKKSQSGSSKASANQKLSREEERAMAMEQIAGLSARGPRRRKQDIKPLPVETSELVSTLGADWSDDEDASVHPRPSTSKNSVTSAVGKPQKATVKKEGVKISTGVVLSKDKPAISTGDSKSSNETVVAPNRRLSTGSNITNVLVLPAKQDSPETSAVGATAANAINMETADATTDQKIAGTTGFKRTRAIKRRIIWDPDAPETTFSYANLVRKDRQSSASPIPTPKSRSITPNNKRGGMVDATATTLDKKTIKRAVTPSSTTVSSKEVTTGIVVGSGDVEGLITSGLDLRRSKTISPVSNGGSMGQSGTKKKKVSEIDRLMRDEGAASMLSSLESERNKMGEESDDRQHRPLMRSRAGLADKANKRETTPTNALASTPNSKKPRVTKMKPSNSWDYVYQKKQALNDDSMIIRRRSNSSYSSNASQHRLSIDGPIGIPAKVNTKSIEASSEDDSVVSTDAHTNKPNPKSAPKPVLSNSNNDQSPISNPTKTLTGSKRGSPSHPIGSKAFEFIKPKETKSNQKSPNRRATISGNVGNTLNADLKKVSSKRGPGRPPSSNRNKETVQSNVQDVAAAPITITEHLDVDVRKGSKVAQIVFNTGTSKTSGTFTPELMNKIVDALDNVMNDTNCHAAVLITNSSNYCQGIDISGLATGSAEQRKTSAISLATATKNFLKTLASFPKPLVAGIHGAISGLGVTQLPLFDAVVASDKSTFDAPYAKIGQTPEGFCIWHSSLNIRESTKTKLFWLAEKIQSAEADIAGITTKLTTPDKVNEEAINVAKKMATLSTVTYRHMKKATIQTRLETIISSLDDEFDEISKQWTSAECFAKFKKFVEVGHF